MDQLAIMVNRNNVAEVVKTLAYYVTVDEFVEDYGHMLEHGTVVLVTTNTIGPKYRLVSHVVTLGMFHANAMCDKLNEKTFELVTQR